MLGQTTSRRWPERTVTPGRRVSVLGLSARIEQECRAVLFLWRGLQVRIRPFGFLAVDRRGRIKIIKGVYKLGESLAYNAAFFGRGIASWEALAWHARGQRFDPAYLHQTTCS